jgi:hypothetical protein
VNTTLKYTIWLLSTVLGICPALAGSGTITVLDSTSATRTYDVITDGSGNYVSKMGLCDQSAAANCATVDTNHALNVSQPTAANLNATVVGTGTFATQAAQSGTWTVQPGNTPNSTAWLVTGTGGTFPVTQSTSPWVVSQSTAANLNATVVGTGTFATQASQSGTWTVTQSGAWTVNPTTIGNWGLMSGTVPGAAPTNTLITGGIYNSASPTPSTGQTLPLQLDSSGNLNVNIKAGSGGAVTIANGADVALGSTTDNPASCSLPLTSSACTISQDMKNLVNIANSPAAIVGFRPTAYGTPISVTTGGVTGTLPAGTTVVATNVGSNNGAYCALGGSATTSDQYIAPNGGWFQFYISGDTQLTCITASSTTTVNMAGGTGLPTGTGGGGGGSGGNSVNVTPTDCSGSISMGMMAQPAFGAGATKHGFIFMNLSADPMWISFNTTAAIGSVESYLLPAGSSTVAGGSFASPAGFGINTALSVIAANSTDKYSCTYW